MCSHDLSMTCEKFYHEIPTTMFIISFLSYTNNQDLQVDCKTEGGRRKARARAEERKGYIEHAAERERRDDGRKRV